MGEAKRRRDSTVRTWPGEEPYIGKIDLHLLPPDPSITGGRLRKLTGDERIDTDAKIILKTYRAVVGDRLFHVGFCIGNAEGVSAVGVAVVDRLAVATSDGPLHVVPVAHADIAFDIVLRHLRTFTGRSLLFTFPNSDVYDAGVAETLYSKHIRQFDPDGVEMRRLSQAERRNIRSQADAILGRPPTPKLYALTNVGQEDVEWIFRVATPAGKVVRTAVWNGRRDYAHHLPDDIVEWVGGDQIAIVQVDSPVGIDRRSSIDLTHKLALDFDGIVHWTRDTKTYESVWQSFVRLEFESVGRAHLPEGWSPDVTILAANS